MLHKCLFFYHYVRNYCLLVNVFIYLSYYGILMNYNQYSINDICRYIIIDIHYLEYYFYIS